MIAHRFSRASVLALLAMFASDPVPARAASPAVPPLKSVRALVGPLTAGRRAEAALEYDLADPFGGTARHVKGRLAVEAPDRVRLDFVTTGEHITLRGDGGEWLQPANHQMVRIPAGRAGSALAWWRLLLPGSDRQFREDSLGGRRFRLTPRDEAAGPYRVMVTLDPHGLPAQLTMEGSGEDSPVYRFSGWRFVAAKGLNSFRQSLPPNYEAVDLP